MSSNTNSVISNQSGLVGAIAAVTVVNTSDVSSNNSYHNKPNFNSKWNKANKRYSNGANRGFQNTELNNDNIIGEQAALNTEIDSKSQFNNSQANSNKKWSNYKKKKPTTPEQKLPNAPKKNSSQGSSPSFNAAEFKDDFIDSPVYAGLSIRTGSKKTNLNHLLNFTYESSKESAEHYYEYEKYSRQFWSTKFSKSSCFSKEQFLQANCQFVVKNTGDYTVNLCDPDLMVDWDKIEEIHIESHDNISCPICLYPPQIGKIAKCGHIFNWSCILHYLSLSDKAWRKCPICFESIYRKDLKSVCINKFSNEFKIGDEISFNLMFKSKNKNSTLILPHSSFEQLRSDEKKSRSGLALNMLNEESYPECSKYLKLHSRTAEQIHETILKREREELTKQLESEKNEPEVCFVNEALELLNEREINLKLEFGQKVPVKKIEPQLSVEKKEKEIKINEKADIVYADAFENLSIQSKKEVETHPEKQTEAVSDVPKSETSLEEEAATNQKSNIQQSMLNSNSSGDLVFFYQSTDGQRIYINQLNARCLVSQYTSFNQCPNVIKGKIIAYESFFMTEENRKRFKYLSHLPLHSEFKIVELDLKEPYINQATLNLYGEEIEERKQFRIRKEMKEKRLADRAAAANFEAIHYYTSSAMNEIRHNQTTNIVDYSQEFPEASTSPPTSSGASISGTSINDSSNSEHPSNQPQQISFAQMLKHPNSENTTSVKKNVPTTAWPTLESSSNTSTQSSNQLTSGWLTMVKLQQSQQATGKTKKYQDAPTPWSKQSDKLQQNDEEIEAEEIDSMPAPLYASSFFSAIDESLKVIDSKKASLVSEENQSVNDGQQKEKLKKKKKTKHLLFSTSLNI